MTAGYVFKSLIFLLIHTIPETYSLKQIKLGVPIPWSGEKWDAGRRFAAGITIAVEAINKDPHLLPGYNVSFVWGDSKCEERDGLAVMLDMYTKTQHPVNAIIGPACSDGCKVGAMMASHWNIPIISYGCAASFLSSPNAYPNFARTVGVYSKSGRIFVELMKQYNWNRIAILTPTSGIWSSIMNEVRRDIENENNLEVSYFQNFNDETVTDDFIRRILSDAVKKSHSKYKVITSPYKKYSNAPVFSLCGVNSPSTNCTKTFIINLPLFLVPTNCTNTWCKLILIFLSYELYKALM